MNRVTGWFAAGLLAAVSAVLPITASSASAASGACASNSGVTVVVDYGSLGGGVVVRCASSTGTGLDALHAAGFSTEGTQKDGPAFVCRIGGKPSAAQESCVNTPPRSAYWSYWIASDGGQWKYSQSAASNRKVVPGGFEGWRFGAGSAPNFTPQRAGASAAAPSAGTGSPGPVTPTGPGSADATALPKPKPRTAGPATPSPSLTATPSADAPAEPAAAQSDNPGNRAAPWLAGLVVLGLAGAAVFTARRRASRR